MRLPALPGTSRQPLLALIAIGILSVSIAACGSVDPGTGAAQTSVVAIDTPTPPIILGTVTPAIPSSPVSTPSIDLATPLASDPLHVAITAALAYTGSGAMNYVSENQLFVTGRVTAILPARWTTPDGQRPADPHGLVPQTFTIVTPVVVTLDGPPVVSRVPVDLEAGQVVVLVNGGQMGEDSVVISLPWMRYTLDEKVLVALSVDQTGLNQAGPIATEAGPGWWVTMKWNLTDDGQAVAYYGARPAVDVIAELQEAAAIISPSPSPTPTLTASPTAAAP